jgi:hypothetical protein
MPFLWHRAKKMLSMAQSTSKNAKKCIEHIKKIQLMA